jgi:hypothetical protein
MKDAARAQARMLDPIPQVPQTLDSRDFATAQYRGETIGTVMPKLVMREALGPCTCGD